MDQNRIKQLIAHAETGSLRDMAAALRELADALAKANAQVASLDQRVTDLENA